jgi:hypothetical protein
MAILKEIEDSTLLWYCAVSNGGYGGFERVFFLHVQNLSHPTELTDPLKENPGSL